MARGDKKRKRAQYAEDNEPNQGLAWTLAALRAPEPSPMNLHPQSVSPKQENAARGPEDDGWTTVTKSGRKSRNKRMRREHNASQLECVDNYTKTKTNGKNKNYPAVTTAALHTFNSSLKLSDLQSLVFYCLADGVAPQWLSVRHHGQVEKAVVLFVPGLETGMFNGEIALPEVAPDGAASCEGSKPGSTPNGSEIEQVESHVANQKANHDTHRPSPAGISPDEYLPSSLSVDKLPLSLRPLADIFELLWHVKAPGDEKYYKVHSPLHAMLTSPMPKSRNEREAERNMKGARPAREGKHWENKPTPITAFVSSKEDLLENEYTLHPAAFTTESEKEHELARREGAKENAEHGWIDTLVNNLEDAAITDYPKGDLTAGRTVLAMDCEMCKVEGGELALTRISLVAWDGEVVMDELVKPTKPIIDYLTPYSGITPTALAPITTTLADIQTRLLTLLNSQTIIIGHSLNSDLTALHLTHPLIIDTSLLYPHPRGPPLKSSLKWLTQKYLSREIQRGHGATGHDSVEDARACLDLVRLKCEKGPQWGSMDAERESIFKRLSRTAKSGADGGKKGAIVDHGAPEKNFGQMASCCIGCNSDAEVVEGVRRAVLGDEDGKLVPGGGVELTWARLRELEALRGWMNDHRQQPPDAAHPSPPEPSPAALAATVASTVGLIKAVYDFLPPCTLLIVYSGTGDPRPLAKLQEMQKRFKEEYKTKKWDQLSVKWTDREEQAMREACRVARSGLGFVGVK